MKKSIVVFALLALISCKKEIANPADTIYFGGDIITMEGNEAQYAEAVAIKDGKILFVGSKSEAEKFQGNSTEMKDLEGKTLLPGFIDPHSHFMSSLAMGSQANCQQAPAGEGNSVTGIIKALQKIKTDNHLELILDKG
jgi:predicted amidohydrolase YtcJ